MNDACKFVLYGFDGKPKSYYRVTSEDVDTSTCSRVDVKPGHSIIVVDRSGSMWNDIGSLKDMLVKLLTLDEYNNSSMLVSLLSYSTKGDCSVHFQRVPVKDVMKANSPQQAEIKRIRSSGLTCISQAMSMAKELVRADEPTAIILHSDGYANDPSTYSEQKQVTSVCESFRGQNVFVNTVAYRESSDFAFLSAVANAASGTCVKADSVKDVYDALHEAAGAVNGDIVPPIEIEQGAFNSYIVFMSKSKARINGSSGDMTVAGLSPDDDGKVYRYDIVSEDLYKSFLCRVDQHGDHVLALARAKLADGRINEAKFAAYSSCIEKMTTHAKALTGPQLAAMAVDIEGYLFKNFASVRSPEPKSLGGNVTVTGVLMALDAARDSIMLNLGHLKDNYKLRGVKKIPGVRTDTGVEPPWLELEFTDAGDWVPMGTFDFNRNSATINMLITRPSRLVKTADRKPVSEVAGINVGSLPSFRNYTVVGDGEVVVPELRVKFSNKEAFDLLNNLGAITGGTWSPECLNAAGEYNFNAEYRIKLDHLPVASYNFSGDVSGMKDAFRSIVGDKVVAGILTAIIKETSADYTPEQLAELNRHYLSSSLYVSLPMTMEYANLDEALKDGRVDTRVSYKVEIGDKDIVNSSKLYSANEFLARHFMVIGSTDKPKWPMFLDPAVSFQAKPPSARMKLTEVDSFCKPIFEEFLGLATNGKVKEILKRAGVDKSVMDLVRGGVKVMSDAKKKIEEHLEETYRSKIIPFVFFVGATGLLPDCLDAKGLSADELEAQIVGLKLGKDERDGTFFVIGDVIVSVFAKNEYYSTGKTVTEQVS